MAARALIPLEDLRRWAKVAREEGVSINGHRDPSGAVSIFINPVTTPLSEDASDTFDARMSAFARK